MTLRDLIASDVDDVFLQLDDFAETVVRYAGGDRGRASMLTAVVTWQPTVKNETKGQGYVRRAELLLNDDVTITTTDAFSVAGLRMEVEAIDRKDHGSQTIMLVSYEQEAKGVRKAGEL